MVYTCNGLQLNFKGFVDRLAAALNTGKYRFIECPPVFIEYLLFFAEFHAIFVELLVVFVEFWTVSVEFIWVFSWNG
jgi:hypothetical protein